MERSADGVLPVSRRRRAYAALILGTVLSVLDASIANIALPTIGRDLHASPSATVWVTNAFQLAVTASLFAFASLGQARGPATIWRFGIATFAVGSLLCALSHSFDMLVFARIVQGIGGAAIMSLAPALIRDVYPRSRLGHAFGLNAMYTGVATAAGPTAGGLMLAVLPWQWLFAINLPLAAAIFVLARGAVPDVPGTRARLDLPSIVTSAVGFSALVYGLTGFARGTAPPAIALELLAGAAAFAWFVRRQFVLPQPLIALDLFRLPRFSVAAQASFTGWAAWSIGVITLPFFLQLDYGMSPLQSGLLMTSWPISTALVAITAGWFADRYAVGLVSTVGLVIFSVALAMYAYAALYPNLALLVGAGIVGGAGFGIFQTPNNREIMGSGPPEKGGSVAAIFASLRVGGQTFGASLVAIVFALVAPATGAHVSAASLHGAVLVALGLGVALSLVATFVSAQRALRDGFAYQAP